VCVCAYVICVCVCKAALPHALCVNVLAYTRLHGCVCMSVYPLRCVCVCMLGQDQSVVNVQET